MKNRSFDREGPQFDMNHSCGFFNVCLYLVDFVENQFFQNKTCGYWWIYQNVSIKSKIFV